MKRVILFIIGITLVSTVISCNKSIENDGLVGKWKLVEEYYGYAMGGNYQWNAISDEHSHVLSFTSDGSYWKKVNSTGAECTGTYIVQNGTDLEITSNCNTRPDKLYVSELTPSILILDRTVIEGKIRYKYVATK